MVRGRYEVRNFSGGLTAVYTRTANSRVSWQIKEFERAAKPYLKRIR